jgi:hypothetical protein
MLIRSLLLAILAAGGIHSNTEANDPPADKAKPGGRPIEDQHFCCQTVDPKTMSGEGCTAIGIEQINGCSSVLYCPQGWAKENGDVSCD